MTLKKSLLLAGLLLIAGAAHAGDWDEYQSKGHKNPIWDSYVETGFSAYEAGNSGQAELFLQRALARGCKDGLVIAKIGLYYESQKNYQKALNFYQKAQKDLEIRYPQHELTQNLGESMGRVYFLMGRVQEAIPYLTRAAETRESFVALYFLGQIARKNKELDKAVAYFNRALATPPPPGTPLEIKLLIMTEVGRAYTEQKKMDEALAIWEQLLTLDPQNKVALENKIKIEKEKQKERERKIIEQYIQ